MSFFDELKRRNVVRVGVAYIVASWVFLQVADLVFDAINAPEWVLQALLALAVMGFIAALIIAWAYEVTPEGIKREKDVDRSASVTNETATKLDRVTIGLVIAAIAVVAVDRMIPERGSDPLSVETVTEMTTDLNEERALTPEVSDEPSVAVLPFVNMSSDPEQEFFSDGISEEILNVLTRIPNLKVAARTSSFQFKGQNQDIADIAQQLKVNHILEGSVRKAGSQLRITAQLIEAQSGFHLWSDTYDRQLEDIFAIQDEIAGAIAGELRARLTDAPIQAAQKIDIQAYQSYLKGRGLIASRKIEGLLEGIELLKSAVAIEPQYAPAMATMARAYVVLPYFDNLVSVSDARASARDWSNRALAIDPQNAEAMAVKAVVLNEVDLNSKAALEVLRDAVRINPGNLAVNNFLGDILFRTGNLEEALVYESRAAEVDPLSPVHLSDLGHLYTFMREFDKVLELSERALDMDPAFYNSHQGMMEAWWALGDAQKLAEVTQTYAEATDTPPENRRFFDAAVDLANGDSDAAREKLEADYDNAMNNGIDYVGVAFFAAKLGDFDMAGELLLKAYEAGDGTWNFPLYIRLPEQAPDSKPWQEFWSLPGPSMLAELRRKNGMNPHYPKFGEAAEK